MSLNNTVSAPISSSVTSSTNYTNALNGNTQSHLPPQLPSQQSRPSNFLPPTTYQQQNLQQGNLSNNIDQNSYAKPPAMGAGFPPQQQNGPPNSQLSAPIQQHPNQFKPNAINNQNNNNAGIQAPPTSQFSQLGQMPPAPSSASTLNKRPAYPQQPLQSPQQYQYSGQQNVSQQPMYPQQQQQQFTSQPSSAPLQYQSQFNSFSGGQPKLSTAQHGFNKLWGHENVDLMQQRHVLPSTRVKSPSVELGHEFYESVNCSPE